MIISETDGCVYIIKVSFPLEMAKFQFNDVFGLTRYSSSRYTIYIYIYIYISIVFVAVLSFTKHIRFTEPLEFDPLVEELAACNSTCHGKRVTFADSGWIRNENNKINKILK